MQAQLQVQKVKGRIPRVLLGTSPFIGAGQFGSKAFLYYTKFHSHPERIASVMKKAVDLGINGVQLLPYLDVVRAVELVQRELEGLNLVGTLRFENPLSDIELLKNLGATAMLLHAELVDRHDRRMVDELLNRIRRAGSLAGVATHKPVSTLAWLKDAELEVDVIMLPFNKLGRFMDSSPEDVLKLARKLDATLVGKKVLAAGKLQPEEGLEYALKRLDVVAVGVASEAEAEETFSAANKLLSKYPKVR